MFNRDPTRALLNELIMILGEKGYLNNADAQRLQSAAFRGW
jgi:hypothetical protein